jgi:hypothetical protein
VKVKMARNCNMQVDRQTQRKTTCETCCHATAARLQFASMAYANKYTMLPGPMCCTLPLMSQKPLETIQTTLGNRRQSAPKLASSRSA